MNGDTGEILNRYPAATDEGRDTSDGKMLNIARIFPLSDLGIASASMVARDGVCSAVATAPVTPHSKSSSIVFAWANMTLLTGCSDRSDKRTFLCTHALDQNNDAQEQDYSSYSRQIDDQAVTYRGNLQMIHDVNGNVWRGKPCADTCERDVEQ